MMALRFMDRIVTRGLRLSNSRASAGGVHSHPDILEQGEPGDRAL